MVVLKYYIESTDPARMDALGRAMKSLEYIFKFIIRSRFLFAAYVFRLCFDRGLPRAFDVHFINTAVCQRNSGDFSVRNFSADSAFLCEKN